MKKKHRLFLFQFLLAFLSFLALALLFSAGFYKDPDSRNYVLAEKKITNLRESSSLILEDLLKQNEVTFDPTNGVSIETVLKNLKCSPKRKILLLGSSQLVTLNDDWSADNYLRRVDKKLESSYDDEVVVYNLSMGGMTIAEKKIVLDKVQQTMDFDKIIVSIGPYDCREINVRPGIAQIENKLFGRIEREDCAPVEQSFNFDIEKLNSEIESGVKKWLEKRLLFFENKGAIKMWTEEKAKALTGNKPFYRPKKALSWRTNNQKLNDITGWVEDVFRSGKKSLKITKEEVKTNASWGGFKVDLEKPTKKIVLGGWSKSENVVKAKLYCLDFKIDFVDGSNEWVYQGLEFEEGTNDWTKRERVFQFDKEIKSITPKMLFYQGTGTVWFDDIYARPIYRKVGENVILNPNVEDESNIKDVHTLKFEDEVWNEIFENAQDMVDYIGKMASKNTREYYVLIPPIYNSEIKKGYEQDFMLQRFKEQLDKDCKNNNVQLLDANELLDESHFIEYESGARKGMIEPLHFDTRGHEKLANYLKIRID